MKKIIILSFFIANIVFGQSVTISPSANGTTLPVIKTLTDRLGLEHTDGTVRLTTYLSNSGPNLGGWLQTLSAHPLIFSTNNGAPQMVLNNNGNIILNPSDGKIGKVGIGISRFGTPNQILDVNGRMRIRHTPGYTSGVWMSNSTNGLTDADGAFIGLNTDTQAGIFIGNAWRFGFNSNGNAVITGFTQLGNSTPAGADASKTAPAIKTLKLTGTTDAAQGGSVAVAHGLPSSKILSYTVLVDIGATFHISPEYTGDTALNYTTFFDSSYIFVVNTFGKSNGLLSKPFRVLITYEQ